MKELGLKVLPAYGELDLLALRTLSRGPRTFTGLARFPGVVRDLALVVDEGRPYGDIERTVREAAPRHLEGLELFDVFRGAQIGKGRKSLAIRLAFRSPEGTLTSDEVEAEMQRLMGLLRTEIGAEVRGA
jgi:phenylalanyl-tRNA synthetase beta chain